MLSKQMEMIESGSPRALHLELPVLPAGYCV